MASVTKDDSSGLEMDVKVVGVPISEGEPSSTGKTIKVTSGMALRLANGISLQVLVYRKPEGGPKSNPGKKVRR